MIYNLPIRTLYEIMQVIIFISSELVRMIQGPTVYNYILYYDV